MIPIEIKRYIDCKLKNLSGSSEIGLREELDLRLKYIKKVNADFVGSTYNFTVTVADGDFINNPPLLMFWAGSGSTVYEISMLSPSIFNATTIEFTNSGNLFIDNACLIIGYVNA